MPPVDLRNEPLLGSLLTYWERKREGRAMPRRRDIDPLDMPARLLPHLQLIELVQQTRWRYRLIGTAVVDAMGRDATGRYLDEAFSGEQQQFLTRFYRTVTDVRRPAYASCWLKSAAGTNLATHRLATPLSENDAEVNMILCATSFRLGARGRGMPPPLGALEMQDSRVEVL